MSDDAAGGAEIIKFYPADAAKDPDNVLELAAGTYSHVLIMGWRSDDGTFDARASMNMKDGGDLLWLVETFKKKLMDGDFMPADFDDEG